MPQYDEDMQRRRQKREAQRKKREAEAKRMKRMLILAVLALALCGVGIYLLVQRMGGSEESVQALQQGAQTEAPTQATRATPPAQQRPTTTIHSKAPGEGDNTDPEKPHHHHSHQGCGRLKHYRQCHYLRPDGRRL